MAVVDTYSNLVRLIDGLHPGDTLTIGSDAVRPALIEALKVLSLTFDLTFAGSSATADPPSLKVVGTAEIFGLDHLATTLEFKPLDQRQPAGAFAMSVRTGPAAGTRWELAAGFGVTDIDLDFRPMENVPAYAAEASCRLVVGNTAPLALPISLTLPTHPGLNWVATGAFEATPLTPETFALLTNGLAISQFLPSPLDKLSLFGLRHASIAFAPPAGITEAYLEIAYTAPFSALGIIDVPANGVSLGFMIATGKSAQSYVELDAKFTIASVPVEIGAHFAPGDFQIWGRLQRGRSVSISALFDHFKVRLPEAFPEVDVQRLSLLANLSAGSYGFDFGADLSAGAALRIDHLSASVAVSTTPQTQVVANFSSTIVLAEGTAIFLSATYDGGGGGLTLLGSATHVPIGTLIAYWAHRFGIGEVPAPIASLDLAKVEVSYNTATGDFHFACTGDFKVYETPVEVTFSADLIHTATGRVAPVGSIAGTAGYSVRFGGSVQFAGLTFAIGFERSDLAAQVFVASYSNDAGTVLLHDLVAAVSQELATPIHQDIAIGIKALKFAWLKNQTGANAFLFGADLGAAISLSDVPVIGDKLPPDAIVKFDQLQFAYASAEISAIQAGTLNGLFPANVGKLPSTGLARGVLITGDLQLGSAHRQVLLPIPASKKALQREIVATTSPASSASLSINVQKQFGPVTVQKLGLVYDRQRLFVTGDIVLDAKLLSIGLLGLGIGSMVTRFDPAVTLSGLTIGIDDGPLQVKGGLLGQLDPLDFYGALSVVVPSLSLGALGGYAQRGADPSFFLYVAVNRPLFGYPFFYLDGLAGGIGFNRDLVLPDIDGVADFPLVKWATGGGAPSADPGGDIAGQVATVVTALKDSIPPRIGEYWVAAGLNFSSFGVLHSFALATVAFGTDLKVALLGLTTASLPPQAGAGVPPIAYVEMALAASFSPATGSLRVAAKLTPASFIMTRDCHLTGGFAYYSWFKDDPSEATGSYKAGDFVVTLGGYNPAFAVPKFYPSQPLLGFNWRIDGNTNVKGGIYFAITPSAMMAGGRLEAVWQDGDLKAWFIAHADFLLSWKPFYYQADLGLGIGVSFKVDLWFTSFTMSLSISVELSLWGPSFGGRIDVDLSLISFTVWIGNRSKPAARPIGWSDFKVSFLPQQGTSVGSAVGVPQPTDSLCHSSIARGLVQDLTSSKREHDAPDWIVSAETLEIVTFTAIPAKTGTLTTGASRTLPLPTGSTTFGVGPAGVSSDDLQTSHDVRLEMLRHGTPDPTFDFAQHVTVSPVLGNLPTAAWGTSLVVAPSISQVNGTPATVAGACIGYSIRVRSLPPDGTPLPIDLTVLEHEIDGEVAFRWTTPDIPTTDKFDQAAAMSTLMTTLASSAASRAAIVDALNAPGLDLGLDVRIDVDALAREAAATLLAPPTLSYLGEIRVPR